jgi:two-component system NtrC family sensor kinase
MDSRHRVLVIEDSSTYLKILKTYLERGGYEVATAMSAEDGLLQVGKFLPNLILCDYLLPGMKGDEFCKQVKLHGASRNIPIIMLTAKGDRDDITTGLDAGADDYIVKSQDIDLLLLRVKNFLRRTVVAPADPIAGRSVLHRQRVLTIEDDSFYRRMLARILGEEGYEVREAADGEEGLSVVASETFDLVLVDFVMPGIQGDEVCRRLKASDSHRDIPVILLTSRGDKQDMIAGLNAGADDYIIKNTDLEVLKSRIKALIRRKFYQDDNRRIQEELRAHELEVARAKIERDMAQEKARLADELAEKNRALVETNRKLRDTQAALVQAEKMAALGQLAAGIAHEINNPVAYVSNNLETIDRDARDIDRALEAFRGLVARAAADRSDLAAEAAALEEELELAVARREFAQSISDSRQGLERVKNIVLNLRNFSRLDEGEIKVVDLTEGIESTLKIVAHLMKDRIAIEREYGPMPPVECYPGLLNQVFMNLLVNASQAIADTGTIRIRTSTSHAGDTVSIAISDTGCGIPPDLHQRIFDPFFTTKPVGTGTGLGLATSYGIVQKHGGRIQVDSEPGRGSTFTLVVPVAVSRRSPAHG